MFHDSLVKVWTVLTENSRRNEFSARNRRTPRRFTPQLGENRLERRLSLSTTTVTLVGPTQGVPPINTTPGLTQP